jgi:hypothetical protein
LKRNGRPHSFRRKAPAGKRLFFVLNQPESLSQIIRNTFDFLQQGKPQIDHVPFIATPSPKLKQQLYFLMANSTLGRLNRIVFDVHKLFIATRAYSIKAIS